MHSISLGWMTPPWAGAMSSSWRHVCQLYGLPSKQAGLLSCHRPFRPGTRRVTNVFGGCAAADARSGGTHEH